MHKLTALLAGLVLAPVLQAGSAGDDLEKRLASLKVALEQQRQDRHIPGMAFALVKDDKLLLAEGFGHRDVAESLPVTADTLFAIGSTTKAFTSMLVAMLMDEGKMSWEDPVQRHIPFFRLKDSVASEQVTLRDLLCHRTGMCRMSLLFLFNQADRERILRQAGEAEATRGFRTTFQYNNIMFLAAGYAAGQVAGMTWDELVAERIFQPLGMTRSNTSVAATVADDDHSLPYPGGTSDPTPVPMRDLQSAGPAGSINSSVNDMAKWLRLLLARGSFEGQQLVAPQRLDEMWEAQKVSGASYGLGWFIRSWQGMLVAEHGGNIDGFGAQVGLLPERRLGFVLLTNVSQTPLQQEIINLVWNAIEGDGIESEAGQDSVLGPPGPALGSAELGPYVGRYRMHSPGGVLQVRAEIRDQQLCMQVPGQPWIPLRWPDPGKRWELEMLPGAYVEFETTDSGFVSKMTLFQSGAVIPMHRIETEAPLPLTLDELLAEVEAGHGTEHSEDLPPLKLQGTYRCVNQGLTAQVTTWVDGRERLFHEVDFGPFGAARAARLGPDAWTQQIGGEPAAEEDADRGHVASVHPAALYGDWFDLFDDIEVVRADVVEGAEVYVCRGLRDEEDPILRFVSAETGRLVQEQGAHFGFGMGSSVVRYEDYREIEGVFVPFRWRLDAPGHGAEVMQYESVEVGAAFPADRASSPIKAD